MNIPSKPIPLSHPNPRILIIGAGVGGLTLANLCEAAGFDYLILEKASEFKPLGSTISVEHFVFALLDQLGIYEDLLKVGKPFDDFAIHTADLKTGKSKKNGSLPIEASYEKKYGYPYLMFARPDLMEALLRKVPKSKILMKKRVQNIQQNKDGVMVQVADGSSYHGHILVGADGCYSPVRESMYNEIEKHRPLPISDKAPLNFNTDCIVGVTEPLDPKQFPDVANEGSRFEVVLPKQEKVSIWYMPLSRNRMGWMVNEVMSEEKRSAISSRFNKLKEGENVNLGQSSDWGSESAEAMCARFSNYPTPYGNATLKTFIDKTPKELISKVLLEEKFFETWQDGRTCLIGDACHKVLPFGAVGALNAMLDALQLANLLYDLKSSSYESIREMLVQYESLRKEHGRAAVEGCSLGGKLFHAKGWKGTAARYVILNVVPPSLTGKIREKVARYRPQCAFLPFKSIGTVKRDHQEYCVRYIMEQEQAGGARKFNEEVLIEIDQLQALSTPVVV